MTYRIGGPEKSKAAFDGGPQPENFKAIKAPLMKAVHDKLIELLNENGLLERVDKAQARSGGGCSTSYVDLRAIIQDQDDRLDEHGLITEADIKKLKAYKDLGNRLKAGKPRKYSLSCGGSYSGSAHINICRTNL
jgi:hypothetical protein